MRKRLRVAAWGTLTVTLALGALLWGVQGALHQVPDFYAAAVAVPAAQQKQAGEQLERNVLALHNEVQSEGTWSTVVTDSQINGWLAVDLPAKFPQLLPATISDPRVAFSVDQMQLACRFEGRQLSAVVNLLLDIYVAEEPNTLAVRIRSAQAGLIPLPLNNFLDQITLAAEQADLRLRWAQTSGDPVALITVAPERQTYQNQRVVLETVEIRAGELLLAGRSEDVSDSEGTPRDGPAVAGQRDGQRDRNSMLH